MTILCHLQFVVTCGFGTLLDNFSVYLLCVMKRHLAILLFLLFVPFIADAQDAVLTDNDTIYFLTLVEREGESLPEVEIKDVTIVASKNLDGEKKNKRSVSTAYRQYSKLVQNVKKVYPYTTIFKERLAFVNDTLTYMESEKERKQYMKNFEKSIFKEFEGDVRKMTVSQGQILIKLIDRETQNTSYQLIKEYRGGLSAAFWQGVAKLVGTNLKATYDPYGEDALIELIVQDIESGWL